MPYLCVVVFTVLRETYVEGLLENVSIHVILGAFAKLRKVTISFVTPVRLFAWNSSVPTGRIFMKVDI